MHCFYTKMPLLFHAVLVFFTEPEFFKSDLAASTYFSVTMTAKNASDLQGLIARITAKSFYLCFLGMQEEL